MKRLFFSFLICFFLLSSVACGISWKPNAVDDVNTTLSEYPEAYILSNNIIEVDIFKASAGYNRYYTPDTNEVLIQNERVYVERKVGAAWVPDGVVKNVEIIETATGYKAIRSHEGVHTFYDVVYVLDDGKPLKFEVNLTAKSEGEYRINWDIKGIMGDNQFVNDGSYKFGVSEDNYKVQIDISDVIEGFGTDYIDVQSSQTVPNGRILDFYFGPFSLGVGENVLVDPLISTSGSSYPQIIAIDLDEDGDLDIISNPENSISPVRWFENNGAESFTYHSVGTLDAGTNYVSVDDLDGDGDLDVIGSSDSGYIYWYDNNGAESFTKKTVNTSVGAVFDFNVTDLDGDGDLDIVAPTNQDDTILFIQNDGSENFNTSILVTSSDVDNPRSVKCADIDEDGDIDIVSASFLNDKIAWHENDGNESFTTHTISTSANGANWVQIVDLDEDGDLDIISTSRYDTTIRWFENNGAESFSTHSLGSGTGYHGIGHGDIDGDGDIDLTGGANNLVWFENNGAESFTSHLIYDTPYSFSSVWYTGIIDIDGDSKLDVCSAITSDGLRWFKHADMDVRTLDLSNVALTGLVVRNGDNVGGFVDVNGYMYFSELEYTSSLYTVSITGDEQDSGMKVKTNTDIGSVSSIKVQFKTLDSSKSYDIYLDDVYKETAYRSGTHDYTYTESGLQTVKLQETKENIQMSLTNLSSSAINASGVTVADAAAQDLVSGAATFEPYKYANGIYPINITNSSLSDGFNFTLTASGLTAAPTTFNGLDSNKYYHVNYDGGLYANIGGVTSYTYNFTSFSTHTVQLVEYTPAAAEDDEEAPPSASSGLITQPDNDIIEIGELILTKDEFDLLTIEQIEVLNVSQDTKDKLIAIKSINVNWWLFILVISLTGLIVEGSHKKGHESIIIISFIGVVISAYKLGYF